MTYGTGLMPPSGDNGYQPTYSSSLAQPNWGQPATIVQSAVAQPALFAGGKILKPGRHVPWWLWGLLGLVLLLVIAYFVAAIGEDAAMLGFVLALVPLVIVVIGVHLIDRWEPEPLRLLIFAVAWGAVVSIALTLLIVMATDPLLSSRSESSAFMQTVIRAPIIEELTKGLGLVLIMAIGKRAFDGPVDGIVYGALVGAGFAFTENIQYFGIQYLEGGAEGLGPIFVLRGVMSPFCHAMFTACIGFALGLAARKGRKGSSLGMFIAGWIAAVALHAFWNGSTFIGGIGTFFLLYALVQFPLFITFILVIRWLRKEEARLTYARLGDYAAAGWFTPQEVTMLATKAGRVGALAWARALPGDRRKVMKRFIADTTELAATRQRAISGRDPQAAIDEHILLQRVMQTRNQLLSH